MIVKTWEETRIDGIRHGHSGIQTLVCPECSHDRKKKNMKCLSVHYNDAWAKCNHCGWTVKVMPEDVNFQARKPKPKVYSKPEAKPYDKISDKIVQWFEKRGISREALQKNKVTDGEESLLDKESGEWVKRNCIQFNYFRNGELVNVKYRDGYKNFKFTKDCELILYGLDDIKGKKEFVICEGEPDKLAWYEAGITNCVSVPNGAVVKGENNLQYMDNCWEYFDGIEKLYLSLDDDVAGQNLQGDIAARIGKEKCWLIDYPEDCKDANDVLKLHGKAKLQECFRKARQFPIEGIHTEEECIERLNNLFHNGFQRGHKVGHREFDDCISFVKGELTIVTGIPNSGKSELMDDVYLRLAAKFGWKFAIISPENQPVEFHIAKLIEKYVGESFFSRENRMNEMKMQAGLEFVLKHFFFIQVNNTNLTLDWVLDKTKELILRKGISALVIDPWNRLEHARPAGETETDFIGKCLTNIYKFKESHNIHAFLVVHPTKIKKDKDGRYEVPTLYDCSGSSNWFNKSDNVMCVYRDFATNVVTAYIQKIRKKFIGKIGFAEFDYDLTTGRYKHISASGFDKFMPEPKQINLNHYSVTPPEMENDYDDEVPF